MLSKKTFLSQAVSAVVLAAVSIPAYSEPENLEQMVVTATRTDSTMTESLSSVSVITREEIERYDYRTLAEALSTLPGVTISNSGGLGKLTSLFVRGTQSNHTQILLNGVKLATNSSGAPQLEHIPIQSIERIELVRGPQSSLYGSSSIGGTIQIFTRDKQEGVQPRISVAAGSHNTKESNIGLSAGNDHGWFNFDAGYLDSDGFDSCDGRSATLFIGCFADEPDNDGYRNKNYSLRAGTKLSERVSLEAFKLYSAGRTHYDGFFNETSFEQYTAGLTANADITKNWEITSSISKGIFNSDNVSSFGISRYENTKNTFSVQSDLTVVENHIFTLGYEYEEDEVDALTGSYDVERQNEAFFTQLQGQIGKHDYRFSVREDDNEQYGHHTSINTAWGYDLRENLHTFINYGEAFTAPTLDDLFFPGFSNPELKPEESESLEIGFSGDLTDINWTISVFHTKIDNLISFENSMPQNISEAVITGVELTAGTVLMGIKLDGQLSLIDPENREDGPNRGNVLPRRAEHTFTLNASKVFGKYTLASQFYASGRRYDDAANQTRLSGFATVDVIGSYQVAPSTSVRLKVANLFDEEYETVAGYNTDSTNVMLSVHYSP